MSALNTLLQIKSELSSAFVQRSEEIETILTAILAGQHVALIGLPGTGKSTLVRAVSRALGVSGGSDYFEMQFTEFTEPQEVFGPWNLKALTDEGQYVRNIEGYLPTARIAFLDEVFKGNSAILNSLLTLLNDGVFKQGTEMFSSPLEVLIGASNEIPSGQTLSALWDRFPFRRVVEPISSDAGKLTMLKAGDPLSKIKTSISNEDLDELRALVDNVTVTEGDLKKLIKIASAVSQSAGVYVSDRRLRHAERAIRARAVLNGRSSIKVDDYHCLIDLMWDREDQISDVVSLVLENADPDYLRAREMLDEIIERYQSINWENYASSDVNALVKAIGRAKQEALGFEQTEQVVKVIASLDDTSKTIGRKIALGIGAIKF